MCPQCGTREADWDPELGGDPDAYQASTHKCFGCEEIARQQADIPQGPAGAGMRVLLIPTAVLAALEAQRELADVTTA